MKGYEDESDFGFRLGEKRIRFKSNGNITKAEFKRTVFLSLLLTALAIAAITVFFVHLFNRYSMPSEENTLEASGTVSDVYYAVGENTVIVEMKDGEALRLVYPNWESELYDSLGCDLDTLVLLLEGEDVTYRRMEQVPWLLEIYANGRVIDNTELTMKQITATRYGIAILWILTLVFPISIETTYVRAKYKIFVKAEKKRIQRQKRLQKKCK